MANPPFVPTAVYKVKTMVELADGVHGQTMVDLGSGDGRIPIAFAKKGIKAVGYEHNPDLVKKSLEKIKSEGLTSLITIHQSDFWEADISPFDIIVVFGMHSIMGRLEYMIQNQAKSGAKIISNVFHFPHLKFIKTKDDVHMYIKQH